VPGEHDTAGDDGNPSERAAIIEYLKSL